MQDAGLEDDGSECRGVQADTDDPDSLLALLRANHDCSESLVLRLRLTGTAHQMVRQCSVCGEQRNGPVPRRIALVETGGATPPPFDVTLLEAYARERADLARRYQESIALDSGGTNDSPVSTGATPDAIAAVHAAVDALVALAARTLPAEAAPRVILNRLGAAASHAFRRFPLHRCAETRTGRSRNSLRR